MIHIQTTLRSRPMSPPYSATDGLTEITLTLRQYFDGDRTAEIHSLSVVVRDELTDVGKESLYRDVGHFLSGLLKKEAEES